MNHSLEPLDAIDTRGLFAPLHTELVALLSSLPGDDWMLPTLAGSWVVRDVVAHLIDGQMRRLSFQRDGAPLPKPKAPVTDYQSLVTHLNALNAEWVQAMRRVSVTQLLGILDRTGREYAEFVSGLDPDGMAFFPVAWAGESESKNWMDVGRDYLELWHHQAQIRVAVGAPALDSRIWLFPVLDLGIRGVHRSWADFSADDGSVLVVHVTEDAGGDWSIVRARGKWVIYRGPHHNPTAEIEMSPDTAWRLLFNALSPAAADSEASSSGDRALVQRFFDIRGVMV